jgi:hypothetical protein
MNDSQNEAVRKEFKSFFWQLGVMHYSFFAGVFLFMMTSLVVVYYQNPLNESYTDYLYIGAPVSSMALILLAYRLGVARFKLAQDAPKLYQKMDAYRAGVVLRMILLDGAAFVLLIAYIFTGKHIFIYLSFVVVSVFLLYKPHARQFIKDLKLNELEQKVIREHYN